MGNPERTRELLGAILKEQLRTTPLPKITVSSLTATAGITRQAFYYHFTDVYDLAVWVFTTEIADTIMTHASYSRWSQGFSQMLHYLADHKEQSYAVLNSLPHTERDMFFYRTFEDMMVVIVDELLAQKNGPHINETDRAFIIRHFALIPLGHLSYWLATNMRDDPDVMVEQMERIMRGTLSSTFDKFS